MTLIAISTAVGLAGMVGQAAPLTLDNVLRQIDRNYPKLKAVRLEIDSARAKAKEKRGAFDPVFTIGTDSIRYNSSSVPGKVYETDMTEGAVEVTTPEGVKFVVGSRRNRGNVKSPFSSTGDIGEAFFAVKVPLLRSLGLNEKSVGQQQAELGIPVAERNFDGFRLDVLQNGANIYWEWTAAVRRADIARNLLKIAQDRAAAIGERVREGDLPDIDRVEIETEVQRRQGNVAKADREVEKAGLKLAMYLWSEDGVETQQPDAQSAPNLPDAVQSIDDSAERQAIDEALNKRPELAAFLPVQKSLQLSLDLAKNDRRPALDFTIGPGYDFGWQGIGSTLKLGILYSIPLRQNTVDGRIDDVRAKLRKLDQDLALTRRQIRIEVEDAVSALRASVRRVEAAKSELALAQRLEQGERDRFDLGEGTLFLLNQRERATAEAASRLVDVLAEYQQSVVDLKAAKGDL